MRRYTYTLREPSGAVGRGRVEARDLPAAVSQLTAGGGRVLRIQEQLPGILAARPRITEHELALFFRHLGSMVETGVPLGEGINVLRRDSPNQHLHHVLHEVSRALARGRPLSEALSQFPRTFPPTYLALVRAGERSGQLPKLLGEIADNLEEAGAITRRLTTALIYPAVVGSALVVIATTFVTVILPQWIAVYEDLGIIRNLPWITRLLVRVSAIVLPTLLVIGVAALIALAIWAAISRSRAGSAALDALKLRLPFLGQVTHHAGLARFAGTLGLLLKYRVPTLDAMGLAGDASGSAEIARGARQSAAMLSRGETFANAVADVPVFPRSLTARVTAAESGSTLPEALQSTGRFYAGHAQHLAALFGAVIEPFFIILLGIGVAFILGGIFAPLLRAISALQGGDVY
ncbi:MAG: type II secretion system F family protein [Armatimonadota bacterium]|nr:MAG: type II secretion system F family protein [Armatimonadota bacterium]